jgi:hypothetical protein
MKTNLVLTLLLTVLASVLQAGNFGNRSAPNVLLIMVDDLDAYRLTDNTILVLWGDHVYHI